MSPNQSVRNEDGGVQEASTCESPTESAAVTTLCNVAFHEWGRLGFLNHNGTITGWGMQVVKGD